LCQIWGRSYQYFQSYKLYVKQSGPALRPTRYLSPTVRPAEARKIKIHQKEIFCPSADTLCGRPPSYTHKQPLLILNYNRKSTFTLPPLMPCEICVILWRCFLTSSKLDLWTFELTTGTPVTLAVGNVHTNCDFTPSFCSWVRNPYLTGRRTDGRPDGRARRVMRLQDGRIKLTLDSSDASPNCKIMTPTPH